MKNQRRSGRSPSAEQLAEAKRLAALYAAAPEQHPHAVKADPTQLDHINTYGALPTFYVDRVFVCRDCGAEEIWLAEDQKWFYEEAKGHIDAFAVRCHACRKARKSKK